MFMNQKVVFCSNFLNHHQLPVSQAFMKNDCDYHFIAYEPVPEERLQLGYADMNSQYPFVVRTYESKEQLEYGKQLIKDADIAIIGSAPEEWFSLRSEDKVTYRYRERLFRDGYFRLVNPFFQCDLRKQYTSQKHVYFLACSAYAPYDFSQIQAYRNRMLKWGYFPVAETYEDVMQMRNSNSRVELLWVARYLELKHPEAALNLTARLKKDGFNVHLTMIGEGEMQKRIDQLIHAEGLNQNVTQTGSVPFDKVREYMQQADIFLFTSDKHEGWGAVLNEAMNSGCACVASSAIGASPFLISNGGNGFIYLDGDDEDLYQKTVSLLKSSELRKTIGINAYKTIISEWNADTAVSRLLQVSEAIHEGKDPFIFKEGPCSKALPLSEAKIRKLAAENRMHD